mmetsp:Transcript_9822/g.20320  ORF Transcript_9822/g.20320 Transcript_9822/m.20320 type:complete len:89 (+) Transcript_9822:930-1196(+)
METNEKGSQWWYLDGHSRMGVVRQDRDKAITSSIKDHWTCIHFFLFSPDKFFILTHLLLIQYVDCTLIQGKSAITTVLLASTPSRISY